MSSQVTPQTSSTISQPSVIVSSQNGKPRIILLTVLSLILLISLVINLVQYLEIFIPGISTKTPHFPINPENSYVEDYSITYYLKTQIKSIGKTPEGLELSTSINDNQAPKKFYITSKTNIYASPDGNKNNSELSDINELKAGQTIHLWVYQDNETGNWVTFKVVYTPTN